MKFDINNPCPKCGSMGAGVKYEKGEIGVVVSRDTVKPIEAMIRNCKVCTYVWEEEPLN